MPIPQNPGLGRQPRPQPLSRCLRASVQVSVHAGDWNKGRPKDSRLCKISKPDKQYGSADEKPDHRIANCAANDFQPT